MKNRAKLLTILLLTTLIIAPLQAKIVTHLISHKHITRLYKQTIKAAFDSAEGQAKPLGLVEELRELVRTLTVGINAQGDACLTSKNIFARLAPETQQRIVTLENRLTMAFGTLKTRKAQDALQCSPALLSDTTQTDLAYILGFPSIRTVLCDSFELYHANAQSALASKAYKNENLIVTETGFFSANIIMQALEDAVKHLFSVQGILELIALAEQKSPVIAPSCNLMPNIESIKLALLPKPYFYFVITYDTDHKEELIITRRFFNEEYVDILSDDEIETEEPEASTTLPPATTTTPTGAVSTGNSQTWGTWASEKYAKVPNIRTKLNPISWWGSSVTVQQNQTSSPATNQDSSSTTNSTTQQ